MKIYSVYDEEFRPYGKVIEGYDVAELLAAMNSVPMPEAGVQYRPGIDVLENCAIFELLKNNVYGGMPVELGMCWGYNTKLNCVEYHRDSEVNLGTEDFILLLGKQDEIIDGKLETSKIKAFRVPAGVMIEVYATTLHYAPCSTDIEKGFRVAVVLPFGTNTEKPEISEYNYEDRWLAACNKWLIAHPDTFEAKNGAYVGLIGENIDIAQDIL